jgi:serine/threonine-protein kinase
MSDQLDRLRAALSDRYRIERELGYGGMATVYLAEDLKHKRNVALKVLKPELAAVLGADRFVQEITTTASLQHPHILPLYDSGSTAAQSGSPEFLYYVMPYIEGETLRDKLDREKQLGIEEAVSITTEVADALDYAHRNDVIHRDIKPENILLHDGRPMVADFGIALAVSAAAGGRMTETGMSLGTPHYMSPEQATAEKDLTNRSDVYSLGCVLYEMLTGSPPHVGSTAQQIIMKIVTEEAQPVTELRRSVPPNVAAAVATSLEKLHADRFESAKTFADALADVTFSSPGTAMRLGQREPVTGRIRPWKLVSAGVGLALVAGSAGWIMRPVPDTPRRVVQFYIESDSGHLITPSISALSPDGSVLVYSAGTGSGSMLYRRRIDELEAHPIPGTEGGEWPFFSPDGTQLGFAADGALRAVGLDGGASRTITTEFQGDVGGAAWGHDGEIVFATWFPTHVYVVSAGGGTPEVLEALDRLVDTLASFVDPVFITDTRALLFTAGVDQGRVGVMSLESGDVRLLMPGAAGGYVRSGQLVYVGAGGSVFAQSFDAVRLDTTGPAHRIVEGVGTRFGIPMLSVSSSGALAYNPAVSEGRSLVLVDRAGNSQLLLEKRGFWSPRFSPDGNRIAFGQMDESEEDVWIHDVSAGTTSRLTFDGQMNNDPVWSPDGNSFAFSSHDDKDLYILPAEGGDPATVVAREGAQWTTDWSPDGRHLVFTNIVENLDIWVAPIGGGQPQPFLVSPFSAGAGRISPNGRWLTYHSNESGRFEVYVQTFPQPGKKRLISTEGGREPTWAPDGRELFYWNTQGQLIAHQLTAEDELTVGRHDVLFHFPSYTSGENANYDVHPDGQRFIVVTDEVQSRVVVALDLINPER